MKNIYLFLLTLFFSFNAFALGVSKTIFNNGKLPFLSHAGNGPFDTYLTMEINYPPVKELFQKLVKQAGKPLKNRGEAHITVITPVEYFEVLKDKISIQEINEIAMRSKIQNSSFSVTCLGKGTVKNDEAFFIVVKSRDLLLTRKKIEELYLARGGRVNAFKAAHFFPHITLGFTTRDLHESDGVIKDEKSCFTNIELI